jgi:hypothetical protein
MIAILAEPAGVGVLNERLDDFGDSLGKQIFIVANPCEENHGNPETPRLHGNFKTDIITGYEFRDGKTK